MFVYVIEVGQKASINTPYKMIDRQIENLSAEVIKNTSTYENGWEITMTQYADRIEIISNKELIQEADGSFSMRPDN